MRVTAALQDLLLPTATVPARHQRGCAWSVTWDRRDNRLFPTNGFFLSASVEIAPAFMAPAGSSATSNLFNRYDASTFRCY